MKLYIMRHGLTNWNKIKKLQGRSDILLAQEGIELAEKVAEGMKDVDIDLVISSPLIRAKQTAEIVMAGRNLPMITDRRIIEMSFGDWEGQSMLQSEVLPKEFIRDFYEDPLHCVVPPKGESFEQVIKRTADFYQSLISNEAYKDKNIFISTHGAASRCLLMNFYEDKEDVWRGGVLKNCTVTVAEVTDGVGKVLELDKEYYVEKVSIRK